MPKRDPRVNEFVKAAAPFARPILRHLRKVIHDGAPALEESIKWGMPAFLHKGKIVCGLGSFKAHCALWFWNGEAVVGGKTGAAMGNFGRITSLKDLPSAAKIRGYVRKGVDLIDRGR
jgi:hypothetical protein